MSENILLKMTEEKNRLINETILRFLGHEPSREERKQFTFMHRLGESYIYFKNRLVEVIRYNEEDRMAAV